MPKFGGPIAGSLKTPRLTPADCWCLKKRGDLDPREMDWLLHAVDDLGEILGFLFRPVRNAKAALKLMRKLIHKQGWVPTRVAADKFQFYCVAFNLVELRAKHVDNNRETSLPKISNDRTGEENQRC